MESVFMLAVWRVLCEVEHVMIRCLFIVVLLDGYRDIDDK